MGMPCIVFCYLRGGGKSCLEASWHNLSQVNINTFLCRSLVEEDDPAISAVVCSRMDDAELDEDLGDDSPMVLDISHQRVPENGEDIEATAEISLFPEYEQVPTQICNNSGTTFKCIKMCDILSMVLFQDVFWFLRSREVALSTKFNYMEKQPDITMNMRQILVDWLVEVSEEYKLQTETLHLAVNYIDRYKKHIFPKIDQLNYIDQYKKHFFH